MQIRDCTYCGEYRFIQEFGYCPSCADRYAYELTTVSFYVSNASSYDLERINEELRECDCWSEVERAGSVGTVDVAGRIDGDSLVTFSSRTSDDDFVDVSWYVPPANEEAAVLERLRELVSGGVPNAFLEELSVGQVQVTVEFTSGVDTVHRVGVSVEGRSGVTYSSRTVEVGDVWARVEQERPLVVRTYGPDRRTILQAWREEGLGDVFLSAIDASCVS